MAQILQFFGQCTPVYFFMLSINTIIFLFHLFSFLYYFVWLYHFLPVLISPLIVSYVVRNHVKVRCLTYNYLRILKMTTVSQTVISELALQSCNMPCCYFWTPLFGVVNDKSYLGNHTLLVDSFILVANLSTFYLNICG